jgi:hypothetical protein
MRTPLKKLAAVVGHAASAPFGLADQRYGINAGSSTFHSALLATPAVVFSPWGLRPRVPKGYRESQFLQ